MKKKRPSIRKSQAKKKAMNALSEQKWLGQAHLFEPEDPKIRKQ